MFSVALIGADGAGKTTVARHLTDKLPFPVSYMYMGSNLEAGNWILPSTWLVRLWRRWRGRSNQGGEPPQRQRERGKRGMIANGVRQFKSTLSLIHRMAEEAFRHFVAGFLRRTGRVVIFDRHFYPDYYAFDIENSRRSWLQRWHGFMLSRVFPRPELVIFLDAPSEVLFARKREGTLELLEARRQDYFKVRDQFKCFVEIDATQPVDQVTEEVAHRIVAYRNQK